MLLKAPWQWVASPLGFNMVLSLFEKNTPSVEKYTKIAKAMNVCDGCHVGNKIFVSDANMMQDILKITDFADIEEADFSKNSNSFTNYMSKYGQLRFHEFTSKTQSIFANTCTLHSEWQLEKGSQLNMKLYNSFNYTEDVKYEGRLLELPMKSNFKLVLILPNEADVLSTLFATLKDRGLSAAINTIQPLFTANAELTPLNIDFRCRVKIKQEISGISEGTTVQYGSVSVSDKGTKVKVLTCVYSPTSTVMKVDEIVAVTTANEVQRPHFYFAIVHEDTPIFIGDLNRRLLPNKQ